MTHLSLLLFARRVSSSPLRTLSCFSREPFCSSRDIALVTSSTSRSLRVFTCPRNNPLQTHVTKSRVFYRDVVLGMLRKLTLTDPGASQVKSGALLVSYAILQNMQYLLHNIQRGDMAIKLIFHIYCQILTTGFVLM